MSDKDLICTLEEAYNASLVTGSVTLSPTFIEHLLVILKEKQQLEYNQGFTDGYQQAISEVNNMERVVRCKDCKHFGRYYGDSKKGVCEKLNIIGRPEEWFCADGERKG